MKQVIYLGPRLQQIGLGYGAIFKTAKRHPSLDAAIKLCPAIAELIVPIAETGNVKRELDFDYAHNVRGTTGRHVTFYRQIQKWLADNRQPQSKPSTIETKHHA